MVQMQWYKRLISCTGHAATETHYKRHSWQMKHVFNKMAGLAAFFALIFLFLSVDSYGGDYQQVAGLIDLRSTFSDGTYDIETLARMAKGRGFEVLVINDHDRMVMEYGLPPFRNIVKKKVELNSINKQGAKTYLDSISKVQKKFPDMILIPGSESAAFYYWTGSYFENNLTAHNHEKRILTIGMDKPEDYENLPILHNGGYYGIYQHDYSRNHFASLFSCGFHLSDKVERILQDNRHNCSMF